MSDNKQDLLLDNIADSPETIESHPEQNTSNKSFKIFKANGGHPPMMMISLEEDFYALPYSYLTEVHYNHTNGIILKFSEALIIIKGKNLTPVFTAILRHKLESIRVNNPKYENEDDFETYIDSIQVTQEN